MEDYGSHQGIAGPWGFVLGSWYEFMVQLSQKEGTQGQQPEGSAAPTVYLGGRRRHPPP